METGKWFNSLPWLLSSFSLTIHCELEWLNEPSPYATEMPKAVQPLRQLVYEAYEKGIGADVIIQAGGKDFKVDIFGFGCRRHAL